MLKKEKPRVVRGGLICEEMGLGKTVISLGIILKNPAPVSPPSGSQISELNNSTSGNSAHPNSAAASAQSPTAAWDKDLYSQTSDENPKIGTILSRGTLVVCPVSLVGQWIEEAKSKLDDPGKCCSHPGLF
jgi:SNF2 family DNA or RNA helicase